MSSRRDDLARVLNEHQIDAAEGPFDDQVGYLCCADVIIKSDWLAREKALAWQMGRTAGIDAAQAFIPFHAGEFSPDNPYAPASMHEGSEEEK